MDALDRIPEQLRKICQWVCWRLEQRGGASKATKVPIGPRTGRLASTTKPSSWAPFEEAQELVRKGGVHGIGFVFKHDFTGIDLDDAVEPDTGNIKAWALEVISACPTYTEFSPSGKGLHLILQGRIPPELKGNRCRLGDGLIEIYDHARFFTMTGNRLPGTPAGPQSCLDGLIKVHRRVFAPKAKASPKPKPSPPTDSSLSDDEILRKAMGARNCASFVRLWKGETGGFNGDDSRADLSLCCHFAFWTRDPNQIERLFRQSGLMRDKWERHDYRNRTIDKALDQVRETYHPRRRRPRVITLTLPTDTQAGREAVQGAEIIAEREVSGTLGRATEQPRAGAFRKPTIAELHVEEPLIIDSADPLPAARIFIERHHTVKGTRALQHQAGIFYHYVPRSNAYAIVEEATVRAALYGFLECAIQKGDGGAFKPTKSKVDNLLDALRADCNLPAEKAAPCWLEPNSIDPLDIMACNNGLLHLPTRNLLKPTPRFFTLNAIQFAFDHEALHPTQWLGFLSQLWANDPEAIETLQEWIGYLLTPRTHLQKMLLLIGPMRSGKGTIARVIRMLLGDRSVCGPTLSNISEYFGLSTLIDKSVAIIADARIGGRTDTAIVTERLLSISGEDTLSIPRKYLPDWNGKLPTRIMLMTNELPRIEDSSGALVSRFVMLTLSESFYGREDHDLLLRFVPELPGILLWALEGLDRLQQRGRFLQPASSSELIELFEDLGSPIRAFVRDRCDVGKAQRVEIDQLFQAWKRWCGENGREKPGTVQSMGRNLRAFRPWIRITQPREEGERVRYYQGIRLKDEY